MVVGELSLDGSVRLVCGVLPMVALARRESIPRMYVPAVDSREAALVPGVEVIPIEDLAQLAAHLSGRISIAPLRSEPALIEADLPPLTDFSEVRGQEHENARWRWPRPVRTTCSCAGRPMRARPSWRARCPPFCRA